MNPFDGTPVIGLSGACVRAINADYACVIRRDRNYAMAGTPSIREEQRLVEPRPSCGGKSILEMIWDQLMEVYEELATSRPLVIDDFHEDRCRREDAMEYGQVRGQALGLATAIAILVNPYAPNVDAVRAEAKTRWEEK